MRASGHLFAASREKRDVPRRHVTGCRSVQSGLPLVGKFAADNNNIKKKNNKNSNNSYRPTPCLNELVVLVLAFFFLLHEDRTLQERP